MSGHTALTPRAHAVVLGGSIAGLLAARVPADHFERVTIVERDKLASALVHPAIALRVLAGPRAQ